MLEIEENKYQEDIKDFDYEQDFDEILNEQNDIKYQQRNILIRKKKRMNIFIHVVLCAACQIVLIVSIAGYLLVN